MTAGTDTSSLFESRIDGETLFQGGFLEARRDQVQLPDGGTATREYVVHPGAVVIVPLLDKGDGEIEVVLERQFRYPVGRVILEFPAGKLDSGEPPFVCAQRELREETGYVAREWAHAGLMHPTVAYSTEFIDIWFARALSPGPQCLDSGEFLDVFTLTPAAFFDACRLGQITDAKTLACALWLQNLLSGNWSLEWHTAPVEG